MYINGVYISMDTHTNWLYRISENLVNIWGHALANRNWREGVVYWIIKHNCVKQNEDTKVTQSICTAEETCPQDLHRWGTYPEDMHRSGNLTRDLHSWGKLPTGSAQLRELPHRIWSLGLRRFCSTRHVHLKPKTSEKRFSKGFSSLERSQGVLQSFKWMVIILSEANWFPHWCHGHLPLGKA